LPRTSGTCIGSLLRKYSATRRDVLEHFKETILMLSREKGYSSEDIKSAMDAMNFNFSEKSIGDIIRK